MSDLISRKALMDVFQEKADDNTGLLRNNMLFAKELVKSIPTAYDVDGTIELMESLKANNEDAGREIDKFIRNQHIDICISIVKGGGQG